MPNRAILGTRPFGAASALLATLLLCAAAPPCLAQKRETEAQSGSNILVPKPAYIPETGSDIVRARVTIVEFARCVIDRNSRGVERALALPLGDASDVALSRLASDHCLESGTARIPSAVLRGAIFINLYRRFDKKKIATIALPALDFTHLESAGSSLDMFELGVLAFGDCVVKRDPALARAVVLAPTASAGQDEAFKDLAPNLGSCLLKGQSLAFSKPVLEGVLAEVLYREAASPTPSSRTN